MSSPYLKNARVDKDEDGDYWLYVQSGRREVMFCFTETMDLDAPENAGVRRTLEEWFTEQESNNV